MFDPNRYKTYGKTSMDNKMAAILDAVLVTMETARIPNIYPR